MESPANPGRFNRRERREAEKGKIAQEREAQKAKIGQEREAVIEQRRVQQAATGKQDEDEMIQEADAKNSKEASNQEVVDQIDRVLDVFDSFLK